MTAIRDLLGRGQPGIATLAINNPDKLNAPSRGAISQPSSGLGATESGRRFSGPRGGQLDAVTAIEFGPASVRQRPDPRMRSKRKAREEVKYGMDHHEVRRRFAALTTAHLADACIRAQVPVRCAPALLRAAVPGSRLAGRVSPARHVGSVHIFLEALEGAAPGDVLVVDNGGRLDESCVGDLVALEAQAAGLEGIVIWGLHRDTADMRAIGLPVFSLGAIPAGPLRLDVRPQDALESATVGDWTVGREDLVAGDDDGVLFVPAIRAADIFTLAETIRDTERRQADRIRAGVSLRSQVQFDTYLARRQQKPSLSFREHLRAVGGAIEE